jgi:hypothetical protein
VVIGGVSESELSTFLNVVVELKGNRSATREVEKPLGHFFFDFHDSCRFDDLAQVPSIPFCAF